ncbi:MAG: Hsp20/alpha crystallin family protein [Cyclobacteriaceae bacterium]|nr:Hsp20/alpha crystallin family protein [Cyclobacteriaceae bacterium]
MKRILMSPEAQNAPFGFISTLDELIKSQAKVKEDKHYSLPAVNIKEDEKHMQIFVQLAGFSKDQITLTVDKGVLHITGKKELSSNKASFVYHQKQIPENDMARSIALPDNVDKNAIMAKMEQGILEVNIPLIKPAQKSITVH